MIVVYTLIAFLIGIALTKVLNTWKLAAEISDKRPNVIVRSVFGTADFAANLVSLKVFK